MLEKIKLSMRIFHNAIDSDIELNIDACMLDLRRVGIHENVLKTDDALIYKAAELYCKWQYDFGGKGDQYRQAFEKLRDAMSLCDSYTESRDSNV